MADEKVTWSRTQTAIAFEAVHRLLEEVDQRWEALREHAPDNIARDIRWVQPTLDRAELLALRLWQDIRLHPAEDSEEATQ